MLKLWLLRPVEDLPDSDDPWEPWFDKVFGFVVRAETESEARVLAQAEAGAEKMDENCDDTRTPWLEARYSTCDELTADGPAEVIIEDMHWA